MFDYIRGRLIKKTPTACTVDVNGVGYRLSIPLSTYERLREGTEQLLYTHLFLRDDRCELYGFATSDEKKLFLDLIAVRGIGGKVAIVILSGLPPERFWTAIRDGDVASISSVKGVGAKTAKRLILELKDKLIIEEPGVLPVVEDAILALVSLGYTRTEARKVLEKVDVRSDKVEDVIKAALKVV
jgi:Holliday junction DNA helicase RuvA